MLRPALTILIGISGLALLGCTLYGALLTNNSAGGAAFRCVAAVCFLLIAAVLTLTFGRTSRPEHSLRTYVECAANPLFTMDSRCAATFANSRMQDYTGASAVKLDGRGWFAYIHPDDRVEAEAKCVAGVSENRAFEFEHRLRRGDGVYRRHLFRATPLPGGDHATTWLGSYTDIEEYKVLGSTVKTLTEKLEGRIEEQARQRRDIDEQHRILVESIKDYAILMLDPQGRILSWTPAAERIMGYRATEIVGQSFERFYTREDIERGHSREALQSAQRNGNFEEEGWRVRKDGSAFWANVVITAVRDEAGEMRGFSTMTRDITVRRSIELQLEEREEQFRLLLECAPDAIVIADDHGHLALINAQAEKLFGYSREELIGESIDILLPASDRERHAQLRLSYAEKPHVRPMGSGRELLGFRKNGESFPIEVSLSPIQTSRAAWVAAGIRDITERKEGEKRLIAERQRAEDANRSKSDFLAAMSHEIRTPMNAILGLADLLWETDLDRKQRDYVGRFRRAGTNLLTLLNDILDLSKIESGRFDLESIDFSLADLLNRTTELLSPRASAKKTELISRIMPGTPEVVVGDPTRLQQVLNNIVGNAIKFTEEGAVELTLQAHSDNRPGHLEFSVRDSGIGIAADKLDAVFEDFTQAESSTTRRFGGTGLGLGICRRLIEHMGGNLTVESVLGEGSTFRFDVVLPVSAAAHAENNELHDLIGRKVLIADDNATNRLILAQTCAAWGMVASEARSGEEACELARQATHSSEAFSLVLLDNIMHGANGFEVLQQLLTIDPTLPVILTSSDRQPGDITKARGLGAAAYAVKPVPRSELLSLISAALGRKQDKETHFAADPAQGMAARQFTGEVMKILIAEDSEDNRFLVGAYLENRPYELTFAEDGRAAVELFAKRTFDLILMDLQMPVMDGLEATAAIRTIERERAAEPTPIVALTANARVEDAEKSEAAGCDGHLAKPISKEKLVAVIEGFRNRARGVVIQLSETRLPNESSEIQLPEGLEEFSRRFLLARRQDVTRLLQRPPEEELDQLRVFGHNMKGNGTPFGFPELTKLGAAIEAAARASNAVQLAECLSKTKEYVEHAAEELSCN